MLRLARDQLVVGDLALDVARAPAGKRRDFRLGDPRGHLRSLLARSAPNSEHTQPSQLISNQKASPSCAQWMAKARLMPQKNQTRLIRKAPESLGREASKLRGYGASRPVWR